MIQDSYSHSLRPQILLCLTLFFFNNNILYALSSLNSRWVYGPYAIPPIIHKSCFCADEMPSQTLLSLPIKNFIPSCWRQAYLQPAPKKGNLYNLSK